MPALRRLLLFTMLSAFATMLLAGPAAAESPWWHVTSGSRPAYIDPSVGHPGTDRVQELIVTTEAFITPEDAIVELTAGSSNLGFFFTEPLAAEFERPPLTAPSLQSALEGPYGAGEVTVTESAPGSLTFEIKAPFDTPPVAVAEVVAGTAHTAVKDPGTPDVPDGEVYLTAQNIGDQSLSGEGSPVEISDVLPGSLEAIGIAGTEPGQEGEILRRGPIACELAALSCTFDSALAPFDALEVRIAVNVKPGAETGESNEVLISGGRGFDCQAVEFGTGAYRNSGCSVAKSGGGFERSPAALVPGKSSRRPVTISTDPPPGGVENYELRNEQEGGAPEIRAGSHPFQQTTLIVLNQAADLKPLENPSHKPSVNPIALPKDFHFNWPPGLIGNPKSFPQCSDDDFYLIIDSGYANACPPSTAIGVATVYVNEPAFAGSVQLAVPLFNMAPRYGEPARFGFNVGEANAPVIIDTSLRSDGNYGITVETNNIIQVAGFLSSSVTVWGTPGDPRHNRQRGWSCLAETAGLATEAPMLPCDATATFPSQHPSPFLMTPTDCQVSPVTDVEGDPWTEPGVFQTFPGVFSPAKFEACNQVPFAPTIKSEPTSNAATSPTGLSFDINVEDEGLENSEGLIQSQIKKAVVTLPKGFTTNPSVAEGLKACTQAQFESETVNSPPGAGCPNDSKVGDVEIESPLIESEGIEERVVKGSLFVAQQGLNPNENLLTLYLVAKNPELGVMVSQALKVTPDPVTGQLTTEVDNIPQLPFSHFHLSFRQGQRSPLVTPPACGDYTVTADLYPYSEPNAPVHRESSFKITQGPEGQPCPSGQTPPFHPDLLAGSENPTAKAFSPFYTEITRKDSEQEITNFSIKLPPGVAGILAGVPYCSDAQIAAAKAREVEGGGGAEEASPSCPAASQVGRSNVGSGVGNVLAYAPGKIYLAGPYHGSNLSLVSITSAKVGPFDLGTVVVRFALRVDSETAEVFIDSTGSDPIPHIVDGIPVHLRDVQAFVDRPQFTFNPTSCAKTFTASTVLGSGLDFVSPADDNPVTISSPFQVGSCASLAFKPKLALSLRGSTKRGGNPAFKAVLTYPYPGANVAEAQVTLPSSEFLDNAHIGTVCTRVQFKEGKVPGEKCPPDSVYGFAKAVTPVFAEPLEGPVYLRSTGTGAGAHVLPDLLAALHNKQVDIALAGHTEGTKSGGIRNTFEAVPDAPVSKFTLELKGGKKGLLENHVNLCARKHRANSVFTGHNGKVFESKPVVSVRCGKGKGKKHKRPGR